MRELLECFQVLSDPTRLKLLKILSIRPICVCNLVEIFNMSQPAISNQLNRLKKYGLVKSRKKGHWIFYSLDQEGLAAFFDKWHDFWAMKPEEVGELSAEWKNFRYMLEEDLLKSYEYNSPSNDKVLK